MRAAWFGLLLVACGGDDASTDAAAPQVTWTFRDADGNDVGCPPGVTTVELTSWAQRSGPGDSCSNTPNATVSSRETFPCEAGSAPSNDATRIDFKLDDGRVYARVFPASQKHVDVLTPRGFVALSWSFYNPTKMTQTWCDGFSVVTSTWLGPHERFPCTQGSPTMTVLPGQPVGPATFDVWLAGYYEACGNVSQKKTLSVTIAPDQIGDAMVQFTSGL